MNDMLKFFLDDAGAIWACGEFFRNLKKRLLHGVHSIIE